MGFDPTASDLLAINAADVIVMNGLGLEPWLERAIDALGEGAQGILVEAADAALAREGIVHGHGDEDDDGEEGDHGDEEGHEDVDPHMWLDPTLAVRQVERIRDAFAAADAANADAYKQNADALIAELDALDEEFAEGLGDCRHEHFVASHAAYGYLAGRYGAEQVPRRRTVGRSGAFAAAAGGDRRPGDGDGPGLCAGRAGPQRRPRPDSRA